MLGGARLTKFQFGPNIGQIHILKKYESSTPNSLWIVIAKA
jgi:hypothetical protein